MHTGVITRKEQIEPSDKWHHRAGAVRKYTLVVNQALEMVFMFKTA